MGAFELCLKLSQKKENAGSHAQTHSKVMCKGQESQCPVSVDGEGRVRGKMDRYVCLMAVVITYNSRPSELNASLKTILVFAIKKLRHK